MTNDIEALLLRHVQALDPNTSNARQALYSRIRAILLKTLGAQEPPPSANHIQRELQKLEDAIKGVEAQHAASREAAASRKGSKIAAVVAAVLVVIGISAFRISAFFNTASVAISAGNDTLTQEAINQCWEDFGPRTVQFGDSFLLGWSYFTGATYFVIQKTDVVDEYNSKPLTESDRLNGIEWQGTVFLRPTKFQTTNAMTGNKWHWQEGSETLGRNGYTCNLQKIRGNWQFMSPPMWIAEQLKRPDLRQVPLGWQMTQDDEIAFSHLYKAEQEQYADAGKAEADRKAELDRKMREATTRRKTIMQFTVKTPGGPLAIVLTDVSVEVNNQVAWFGGIKDIQVLPGNACINVDAAPAQQVVAGYAGLLSVCVVPDQLRNEFYEKLMAALSAWREKFKDLGLPVTAFPLAYK